MEEMPKSLRDGTNSVFLRVYPLVIVCDDTFPLCLQQTSKRHIHPALTLSTICAVLWEFMAFGRQTGPPECAVLFAHISILKHSPHKCTIQPSTDGLR